MSETLDSVSLDTSIITEWHSIITLLVFVFTNLVVLFPFHIPIFIPKAITSAFLDILGSLRIVAPRGYRRSHDGDNLPAGKVRKAFVRLNLPMNFMTAPLVADLFLLAIVAIGKNEVSEGTLGANNIVPLDIMAFFITLAYIAISIDASGLIRYLAFKVLEKGGKAGHKLFFYLYTFFFVVGTFIGNDPIILSGTAFLAYMTRVSSNIVHPRAWIHAQFAIANIASAILVSSNPTNLVLAGAFEIKFVWYTAYMIVPVVVTAIVLFPFLLYIIFNDEKFIPSKIKMHELPEEARTKKPVNPNIPNARGNAEEEENKHVNDEQGQLLSLEEIMNPFLDKGGAAVGGIIMAAALVTVIVLNAVSDSTSPKPVYWVTLPAAFVMFCWDLGFGWYNRHETRRIAKRGREEVARAREEQARLDEEERTRFAMTEHDASVTVLENGQPLDRTLSPEQMQSGDAHDSKLSNTNSGEHITLDNDKQEWKSTDSSGNHSEGLLVETQTGNKTEEKALEEQKDQASATRTTQTETAPEEKEPENLVSICRKAYRWTQETFPTVAAVVSHLPFALVPFALSMFVLVQALVTKGWVPVFAYGWDHWVSKTGTIGSLGGMAFLSVILCNFAGTNIGTAILLSRVIQTWQKIRDQTPDNPISDRTFWAAVYGMALGVNYGAFSIAFSASLAGLLWRDILARKHIHVRPLDFARVNLPIIAISMTVGCAVLAGEIYIVKKDTPYTLDTSD
ncbi:hypothetical protein BX600DRAFT_419087 [Xylariales sp. PMI_506]|nr:hypothetical protein BX600DRAFT_419087 [Xylariales sp. PMI_506]